MGQSGPGLPAPGDGNVGTSCVSLGLSSYATVFISEDQGARDRCAILNRGGFARCAVLKLAHFLGLQRVD
jgi:hypothetical protein